MTDHMWERALVLFLASQTCIVSSALVVFAMIGEINRKVTEAERMTYTFFDLGKYIEICRQYRKLYPNKLLVFLLLLLAIAGVALLIAFAWQIGMFR